MIFHENRLLADDSHEISYQIFVRKLGKMWQNLLSAAVVIGALWVNTLYTGNHEDSEDPDEMLHDASFNLDLH